mmetsp:Transcript_45008/g.105150  ORF Transcript_45008/g.105150 Transcript_45008/m.105150 type:complete len:236 (-) Transcript_45008:78-785(-)
MCMCMRMCMCMCLMGAAAALQAQTACRRAATAARHCTPYARDLAFVAGLVVATEPFAVGEKPIGSWFAEEQALSILMSQAESARRLDSGGRDASVQRWKVATGIEFPGMVARSETPMEVTIDSETPRLSISSGDSKTVCEGGPSWARGLLARIGEIAETSSSNVVELRDAPGGKVVCVSTISLKVSLDIPALLLPPFVPAGPFERAGSESIQKLLDRDMEPLLAKFCEAYCKWAG